MEEKKELKFDAKDVEENKGLAALSYIFILFLIPLLTKKDSKFCQAHAKQGLVMCIVDVVASFLVVIPVIGWLLSLLVFVVSIIALINALQGKYWPIPVVDGWTKYFNI